MIEPTLAVQTAIRAALIGSASVGARVPADHIRSGSTRPDKTPCIIMANARTSLHGHDYTAQRCAWVYLDLHIWALSGGEDEAKAIAFDVCQALDKRRLPLDGGFCDDFRVTGSTFPRDPDPECGHGVLAVEALIRWIV